MKENLIQLFWEQKANGVALYKTTRNTRVEIIEFGRLNSAEGPDFTLAVVIIDGVQHAGAIEIHTHTQDWYKHRHQFDERYNQVILHVVWKSNAEVHIDGIALPEIELSKYFSVKDLQSVQNSNRFKFPCKDSQFPMELCSDQLELAARENMELRITELVELYTKCGFDWDLLMFRELLCYAVDPQNRMNMQLLSQDLTLNMFRRYPFIPALGHLLIESGLYQQTPVTARIPYEHFIKSRNRCVFPYNRSLPLNWYLGRIRPSAYPIHILVAVLNWLHEQHFDLDFLWTEKPEHLHSNSSQYKISSSLLQRLYQNVILPLRIAKARHWGQKVKVDLTGMAEFPFENNSITRKMKFLVNKNRAKNGLLSYMCLSQYKRYCQNRLCSTCMIGKYTDL